MTTPTQDYEIRHMEPSDWESVRLIYREGIATDNATFETTLPDWDEWDRKHLAFGRLVAVAVPGSTVFGWAALSPVSLRAVYRGVAEVSVYVAGEARGRGLGTKLLQALIVESETNGVWTLQSSVFPENLATVGLHERCGFRIVGHRERIGRSGSGVWRDTLLMERRSQKVGHD